MKPMERFLSEAPAVRSGSVREAEEDDDSLSVELDKGTVHPGVESHRGVKS